MRKRRFLIFVFFLVLLAGILPLPAYGGEATLCWDEPTTYTDGTPFELEDLEEYELHYGTSTGNYPYKVDVGRPANCGVFPSSCECTHTITELTDGITYYFILTTRSTSGYVMYSNEVSKKMINWKAPRRPNLYIAPIETRYYLVFNKGGGECEKFQF